MVFEQAVPEAGQGGTFQPRFNGRYRATPFGVYKIKEREGWGAGLVGWSAGWAQVAL